MLCRAMSQDNSSIGAIIGSRAVAMSQDKKNTAPG
jgi:hypothetical protein